MFALVGNVTMVDLPCHSEGAKILHPTIYYYPDIPKSLTSLPVAAGLAYR